ncbi:terminase large subunit [Phenylobacterium sp. J426]|uniref:terminase large subunit n=1 Tax=Phenylobacterium sp. J426 TaxID=2898439 RepID=UPI002150A125|nr:terminase TerL endonuclease subunit [Phenylobacterium sp. J426]MCR5874375.1 terminase large subunit [Phenylobacterium sp. J426]
MTRGQRVIAFIERYCPTPEGKLVGRPMRLEPFQRKFILEVYDNPAGTRVGILSIARKNGKSALIAAIMLAHLVGPEARQNSQIVSGARSRKQAAVVYNLAAKMVGLSPELRKIVRPVPSAKTLHGLTMNTEYQALAAEAGTAHGLSPVLAIHDEMGQVRGDFDAFIEAIETAQGAYDDALQLVISTQAPSDGDMLSIRIDDAQRSKDPTVVCHVYAAAADADLQDRKAWEDANPALGSFRSLIEIENKAAEASRMPSVENSFRNLYLNQRVTRFAPFVSPRVWGLGGEPIDFGVFHRNPVYGGLDLSLTTDLTALVLAAQEDEIWHLLPVFWTPEATLVDRSRRDRAPYDTWVRDGFMKATPGPAVEYSFVAKDIVELTAGMDVRKINFDRHRMSILQAELDRLGVELPFEPFGQGFVSMAPAIDAAEIEFLHGRIRHGAHPVLTMCAANAVILPDPAGNRKLDKSKSTGRIDGMVALVMAMAAATSAEQPEGPSVYESRGILEIEI